MPHATILYVEDNELVRLAVKETLELEGWRVETCADGRAAVALIEGEGLYDVLMFDNDLPGVSGVELAGRVRALAHRRGTPVVVVSAGECEAEAMDAGASLFLRKPNDIACIGERVARLLAG